MLKQSIEAYELLDSAYVDGSKIAKYLKERGIEKIKVKTVKSEKGATDIIKIIIPGKTGKISGGEAPTMGIIGMLGGVGSRPDIIGLVSDADGAIVALACALKLADMMKNGDFLNGDVIITTHICPNAPIIPHEPVPFMGSPIDLDTMIRYEVDPMMDAILSIDTTKGNRIVNVRGFAITPTVKEGWILKVSDDLLDTMQNVTGKTPVVVPITMQDIIPYKSGVYHLNSIMQPATITDAPVVGVALTTETPVPGCASGANNIVDIEQASRFCIEIAKGFGTKKIKFYDEKEFRLLTKYASMKILQSLGREK